MLLEIILKIIIIPEEKLKLKKGAGLTITLIETSQYFT